MDTTVGIGLLGAGVVGGSLVERLVAERELIRLKTGLDLEVRRVAVRDPGRDRGFTLPEGVLTDDPSQVVEDDTVELVVEVMGGIEPAGDLVLAALQSGKPVVSANKALIAERGAELIAAAESSKVSFLFEAAVGGGIPIIRPLSETLAGEQLSRVLGIINGTTNYILTQMTEEGQSYADALGAAQELGYAEADPTADVSGADAAAKAGILGSLAFGTWVGIDSVFYEGIEGLATTDLEYAADLGFVVKLIGIAERVEGGVSVRVHPAMLPSDHPLASIRGATNAIFIEGPSVGELLFSGPGAGGAPTATAVLGDVIDAAREILASAQVAPRIKFSPSELVSFDEIPTKWYLRLEVADEPGVLAQIADAFGQADVSIKSVWQEGQGSEATLLIVTHRAAERRQQRALTSLSGLRAVRNIGAVLRVVSDED
jgi:homoserine dehydrogenase